MRHALAGGDAHAGEQRVGLHRLPHAGAEILFRDLAAQVVGDAVLALGTKGEDVPGEEIDLNAAVGGVLHDPAPELDLLVHGHALHHLVVGEHFRADHVAAGEAEGVIELGAGAPDVVQGDLGKLRHLHQRRKGMEAPKREHVVAVARHRIEERGPELALPHLGDVRLRGVGAVGVAGRAEIERDVELDAAPRDVGFLVGILQRVERAGANRLGDVQPAIHRASGIGPAHRDDAAPALVLHANAVALSGGFGVFFDGDGNASRIRVIAQSHAFGGGLTADFLGGKLPWLARCPVNYQVEARGHRGSCKQQEEEGKALDHSGW